MTYVLTRIAELEAVVARRDREAELWRQECAWWQANAARLGAPFGFTMRQFIESQAEEIARLRHPEPVSGDEGGSDPELLNMLLPGRKHSREEQARQSKALNAMLDGKTAAPGVAGRTPSIPGPRPADDDALIRYLEVTTSPETPFAWERALRELCRRALEARPRGA